MAFIVETGEGLSNATSYVSVAEADDYFETYGTTEWPSLGEDPTEEDEDALLLKKQIALNKASRSIDLLFGNRFISRPYTQGQLLQFPRFTFYINGNQPVNWNVIPRLLKEAVYEVALLAINDEEYLPNLNTTQSIKSESFTMGSITESITYNGPVTEEILDGFYKIELLLKPLLFNSEYYIPNHRSL